MLTGITPTKLGILNIFTDVKTSVWGLMETMATPKSYRYFTISVFLSISSVMSEPVSCSYKIPEGKRDRFMSNATRSRIVDYILRRKEYSEEGQTFSFGEVVLTKAISLFSIH